MPDPRLHWLLTFDGSRWCVGADFASRQIALLALHDVVASIGNNRAALVTAKTEAEAIEAAGLLQPPAADPPS